MRFKALSVFAVLVAGISLASCSEHLGGGESCPLLCPQAAAPLNDTTIDAVVVDTFAVGFPNLGAEQSFIIANRGDSLDTRLIIRYDTLPTQYTLDGVDKPITGIDSVFLRGVLPLADSSVAFKFDGVLEAYDVTNAANDTSVASLTAEFTAANKLGTYSYQKGQSPDTIKILLDTAKVRNRVLNTRQLRVGIRMVSTGSDQVRLVSVEGGAPTTLDIYANRDTLAKVIQVQPTSGTPDDPAFLRPGLSDFQITAVGESPAANVLRVGGAPAHRVLFRFHIPAHIVDSSVVIRATLQLVQTPSTIGDATEAVIMHIVPVVASSVLSDLHSQLEFAGSPQLFPVDSLSVAPSDSGQKDIQMVTLVRAWKNQDTVKTPRLAALYVNSEASRIASFDFFSHEAPINLRPKLHITYVTKVRTGQP